MRRISIKYKLTGILLTVSLLICSMSLKSESMTRGTIYVHNGQFIHIKNITASFYTRDGDIICQFQNDAIIKDSDLHGNFIYLLSDDGITVLNQSGKLVESIKTYKSYEMFAVTSAFIVLYDNVLNRIDFFDKTNPSKLISTDTISNVRQIRRDSKNGLLILKSDTLFIRESGGKLSPIFNVKGAEFFTQIKENAFLVLNKEGVHSYKSGIVRFITEDNSCNFAFFNDSVFIFKNSKIKSFYAGD